MLLTGREGESMHRWYCQSSFLLFIQCINDAGDWFPLLCQCTFKQLPLLRYAAVSLSVAHYADLVHFFFFFTSKQKALHWQQTAPPWRGIAAVCFGCISGENGSIPAVSWYSFEALRSWSSARTIQFKFIWSWTRLHMLHPKLLHEFTK